MFSCPFSLPIHLSLFLSLGLLFTPLLCPLSLSHLRHCSPLFPLPSLNLIGRGCRLNQLLKEQRRAGELERFMEECWLVKALVYAQICFGRALQSEQSCRQQRRLHILSEALKVNIITSALIHASTTAVLTSVWECVQYCWHIKEEKTFAQ